MLAIPFVHSGQDGKSYDAEMERSNRRQRLRKLLTEYGSQQELADVLDVEQNYISQLLNGKKPFGEKTARKIEQKCGKPQGWLDDASDTEQAPAVDAWPFSFDRALWDRLSPQQKREIEASFTRQVLGAAIEQAATGSSRKRAG